MTRRLGSNGHAALDEVSKSIITQLQADGRRSYAAIGKAIGLSEAAVRQRVQRLTDTGLVHIVALTDPLQIGLTRQAMVGLRADGDLAALADRLALLPEVVFVVVTAGSFDVLVEIACEDDDHLLRLLNSEIRTLPGVRETETFVYLRLHKQVSHRGSM